MERRQIGLATEQSIYGLELVDDPEAVVLRVVPVDEVDGAPTALVPTPDAIYHCALEQQLGGRLIGLQQLAGAEALQGRSRPA